jgi:hypothetical protein
VTGYATPKLRSSHRFEFWGFRSLSPRYREVLFLEKVGAQLVVLDIAPEHVPDGSEHGVGHGYQGSLAATVG